MTPAINMTFIFFFFFFPFSVHSLEIIVDAKNCTYVKHCQALQQYCVLWERTWESINLHKTKGSQTMSYSLWLPDSLTYGDSRFLKVISRKLQGQLKLCRGTLSTNWSLSACRQQMRHHSSLQVMIPQPCRGHVTTVQYAIEIPWHDTDRNSFFFFFPLKSTIFI